MFSPIHMETDGGDSFEKSGTLALSTLVCSEQTEPRQVDPDWRPMQAGSKKNENGPERLENSKTTTKGSYSRNDCF